MGNRGTEEDRGEERDTKVLWGTEGHGRKESDQSDKKELEGQGRNEGRKETIRSL